MAPNVLLSVALQTACSVGRGQQEGARTEAAEVGSREVALVTKSKGAPGYRTYPWDTGWSRTRHQRQALGVSGQEGRGGRGAGLSPLRKREMSTDRRLEGRNNSNSFVYGGCRVCQNMG